MNTHDHDDHPADTRDRDEAISTSRTNGELTLALRDGLKALRSDDAPSTDLWPGIAARLVRSAPDAATRGTMPDATTPDATMPDSDAGTDIQRRAVAPQRTSSRSAATARASTMHARARRPSRRAWTLPVALAASVALALAVGWQLQRPTSDGASIPTAPLIAHEATSMTREYRAAFAAVDTRPLPAPEARTIAQLDRTAADVRAALKQAPESRLLLDQLKRVYARRLDLSQRFARMS